MLYAAYIFYPIASLTIADGGRIASCWFLQSAFATSIIASNLLAEAYFVVTSLILDQMIRLMCFHCFEVLVIKKICANLYSTILLYLLYSFPREKMPLSQVEAKCVINMLSNSTYVWIDELKLFLKHSLCCLRNNLGTL